MFAHSPQSQTLSKPETPEAADARCRPDVLPTLPNPDRRRCCLTTGWWSSFDARRCWNVDDRDGDRARPAVALFCMDRGSPHRIRRSRRNTCKRNAEHKLGTMMGPMSGSVWMKAKREGYEADDEDSEIVLPRGYLVKLPVIDMSIGILTSKCAGISGIVSA